MSSELEIAISDTREWIQRKLSEPDFEAVLVRRGYLGELFAFTDWRADRPLSKEIIDEYCQLLHRSGYSALSVKRALDAIGWWLETILETSSEEDEPSQTTEDVRRMVSLLRSPHSPPASAQSSSSRISKAQLLSIMEVCSRESTPKSLRDAAIVALLLATDISYASLSRLTTYNVRGSGSDGYTISFKRKDRQEAEVDLPKTSARFLSSWLGFRGQNLGPLFYEIKGTERILWGQAMTETSVRLLLRSRLEEAKSPIDQTNPAIGS
jgi:site-specific recombinase XerD